jgi:steroid 5-alpha reductase family enzyme
MPFLTWWLTSGVMILLSMTALWAISLRLRDASIVDVFWGTGFVLAFWLTAAFASSVLSPRPLVLGALVTIWGVRLSLHILLRNRGKGEDIRYAKWREENGPRWWWISLFKVFLLQGTIMWLVSAPLVVAQTTTKSIGLNWLDSVAAALWLTGFFFEAVGDWQLARFKANRSNQGKLLNSGLWRYTRHPNYFGDAVQWWGFYLFAAAAGGWWSFFSPLLMTYLLKNVSGVALLERGLLKSKPGYEIYIANTNAFFPWFPRKGLKY